MKEITKKQRLLYRFYKEKKIYKSYKHLNDIYNCDFFDTSLRWHTTKEGHKYWLSIQCDFIVFLAENDKEGVLGKKEDLKYYLKKFLTEGYFVSYRDCDTTDNIYIKYKNLYSKIFGCEININ